MGKHNRKNKQKKGVRGNWKLDDIVKENKKLETFYKAQNIVPEEEWETFMDALRGELPASFRFLGFLSEAKALCNIMQEKYVAPLKGLVVDGVKVEPPKVLPWYPNSLGYQMSIPRSVIRNEILLKNLHNFLVTETELGSISRQETVSMIPPLLMDIRPEHKVLDMCAAPGSKTAQLVEHLLADENIPMPSGFVVANDADNKRCYLLVHQALKRLQNANCMVINHDARNLPNMGVTGENGERKKLKFDRILCDAPCSGDGTVRKNIDIWKHWCASKAYHLHKLQFRILKRGFDLLAPEGRMVYSTCSLSPAEDEAVIARLLKETGDSLELVDVSDKLPELKRSRGLLTWKVMEIDGTFPSSFDEVKEKRRKHICASLFPPSAEDAERFHLERCMRILPHQQDTGGFFVAVLEKKREKEIEFPIEDDDEEGSPPPESPKANEPPLKRAKFSGYREDPFIFFDEKDPRWEEIKTFYGITPEFPVSQVLHRSAESVQKRNLFLVNAGIKDLILNNKDSVKIINAGLRIFGRVEQKYEHCKYRLAQDGLRVMLEYLKKRAISITREDMIAVITTKPNCRINTLGETLQKELEDIFEGGLALYHDVAGGHRVSICAWKGKVSLAPYINKDTTIHALRLLEYDTTELEEEVQSNRRQLGKQRPVTDAEEEKSQEIGEGTVVEPNCLNGESVEQKTGSPK